MANQIKKGDIVRVKEEYHLKGFARARYEVRRLYKRMALLEPVKPGFSFTYPIDCLERVF